MSASSATAPVARLTEPILHYPVTRLEDAIRRIDQYSTLGAEKLAHRTGKISALSGPAHGVGTFLRVYFLQLGFLDGAAASCWRSRTPKAPIIATEGVAREAAP